MEKVDFGIYSLDRAAACLLKQGTIVPLPPKALAFLAYLLEQPGRLVSKQELLDKVWGHRFVTEGVLKNAVTVLRQALGDDAKTPRYIETVHKLGYRFIADTAPGGPFPSQPVAGADTGRGCDIPLVGRDQPLAELWRILDNPTDGRPRLAFVNGEAGVGKTAVIETFVGVASLHAVCGRGYCFEHYGPSEPYLPVLEALNDLLRQEADRLLELMRQVAPTWLTQLPWYRENVWPHSRQTPMVDSSVRMPRELGEFLARGAREKPLILVLEDLHWSDRATLDLLAYLARRRQSERWMIVAGCRSEDALLTGHASIAVRRELAIKGLCLDLTLQPWSEAEVRHFLVRRFPNRQVPDVWVSTLLEKTGGLPYFLVSLVDNMPGEIMANDANPEGFGVALPEGMALLLARQFERLPDSYRRILEAASALGMSFSADAVADALDEGNAEVEACLENLARLRQFVTAEEDWSGMAYRFRYGFQREFIYGRLSKAQRRQTHASRRKGSVSTPAEPGKPASGPVTPSITAKFAQALPNMLRPLPNARVGAFQASG